MILMPANNTGFVSGTMFGRYPDKFGLLISPDGWREPRLKVPYALDNGCFKRWDSVGFFNLMDKAKFSHKPLWVCVPDAVADAETTFRRWHKYSKFVAARGFNLAFVAQDGMEPQDVPSTHCVFIGGSTKWKYENAAKFKGSAKILHIGRINCLDNPRYPNVLWAKEIGADSIDGTGWLRGRGKQYNDFLRCFEEGIL